MKNPLPFGRRKKAFASELPVQQVYFLALVSIRIHHDEPVLAPDALDLAQGLEQIRQIEVVQRVDRNHQVETPVGEGKVRRVGYFDEQPDFLHRIRDGVLGNINSGDFEARKRFREVVNEEPFPTADVEDLVSRLQAVVRNQFLRERTPATIIFVTAVAVLAVSVEVVLAELFGNFRAGRLVELNDALEVISFCRLMDDGDEVEMSHTGKEKRPVIAYEFFSSD